jgi:hypothetical protein
MAAGKRPMVSRSANLCVCGNGLPSFPTGYFACERIQKAALNAPLNRRI